MQFVALKFIEVSPVHSQKAPSPMLDTESPIVADVIQDAPENAYCLISVTVSGITTFVTSISSIYRL